tara:strand:- start:271 stop:777 length:507 start_codon:yes stop_codon:yes gene_type:complete
MITNESGLQVKTIREGSGKCPEMGDTVVVHYILHLGTGTSSSEYDYDKECYVDQLVESTYEERPFSGPIDITIGEETKKDGVYNKGDSIKGLDEALLGMKSGGKKHIYIPPELAYGVEGASSFHTFHGYRTPPNRGLDMIVELIEIKLPNANMTGEEKEERECFGGYP